MSMHPSHPSRRDGRLHAGSSSEVPNAERLLARWIMVAVAPAELHRCRKNPALQEAFPNTSVQTMVASATSRRWGSCSSSRSLLFLLAGACDNNHIENRIRPIALAHSNWLFAGSLRGGQRAAAVMSLIQ